MRYFDLKNLHKKILGESSEGFEDGFFLNTALLIVCVQVLSTAMMIVMGLPFISILSGIIGFFTFSGLFLFGRFISRGIPFFWLTSAVSLLYLDFFWFLNSGSDGPMMSLFIVFFAFLILIFDQKYYLFISIVFFVNLIGIMIVEYLYPQLIIKYSNAESRFFDNYIGLFFDLMIIFTFIWAIKKNYKSEFERARKSDQLKSGFLANLSHEIRTPLNAIVGFSSLLAEGDSTPGQKEIFNNHIQQNSDYLLKLIDNIIDVSKIESNQLQVNIVDFEFQELVNRTQQSFQSIMAEKKDVKLILCPEFKNFRIKADPTRLEQIFNNLITNAFKFTDKGTIEIGMRNENDFYIFSVKDTGIGIQQEDFEAIFERFLKIESNQNKLYRGTGIGLYISKKLVEMFGGKIWLESELGRGSCFYFSLPVKPVESGVSNY